MGLFGPNWSWEEIQRKDAVLGDLRRENNRVLDAEHQENDRLIREIEDIPRKQAGARIAQREGARFKSGRLALKCVSCAYIILGNYAKAFSKFSLKDKSVKKYSKGGIFNWVRYIFIACCALLIYGTITMGLESWAPMAILKDIAFLITYAALIFAVRYVPSVMTAKRIENNECYKKILESCKNENIKKIGITSEKVRLELDDEKKVDFCFVDYGYGYLSFFNQGIFLGLLIRNLGLKYDIFVCKDNYEHGNIFDYTDLIDVNFEVDMIPAKLYMVAAHELPKEKSLTLNKW